MKKIAIFFIILNLCFCASCVDSDIFLPTSTKWRSKNKNIEFVVDSSGNQVGTIVLDEEKIDFFAICTYGYTMYLYPIENFDNRLDAECFEIWTYAIKKNKVIVTVVETTYFDVGIEIVFELVETLHNKA